MRYLKKIVFLLILFVTFIHLVNASNDKNLVNIYLFYSDSCIHCASEKELLNEIIDDYDNVRLYKYEVSNNSKNKELMLEVAGLINVEVTGVPFTVIADKPYKGFNREKSKRLFLGTIEYYSNNGYKDIVGEYIGNIELPNYEINYTSNFYEYLDNYGNYKISFFGFKIDTSSLSLLNLSIIMGAVDGFCLISILTLIFVVSIFINIKDKKKMWLMGLVFLGIYIFVNCICLNIGLKIDGDFKIVKICLGIISILISIFSLYVKNKINNKYFWIIMIGLSSLVFFIDVFEIISSHSYFSMFKDILYINNLNMFEEFMYNLVYMLFYILDDFILFFIFMMIVQNDKFVNKYNSLLMRIGSVLLFVVGLLTILNK